MSPGLFKARRPYVVAGSGAGYRQWWFSGSFLPYRVEWTRVQDPTSPHDEGTLDSGCDSGAGGPGWRTRRVGPKWRTRWVEDGVSGVRHGEVTWDVGEGGGWC